MIGIVADDITGAGDIGIMYAKAGWETHIYTADDGSVSGIDPSALPDALIFDTSSRLDARETAYRKVYQATTEMKKLGVSRFFNKTCSVFRGNIGAEFDAMLDALESDFAVVVLGFPKNGRSTMHGIHYVRGEKLEYTEFRNDPVHPMQQSNLKNILQQQTKRKVDVLDVDIVRQGSRAIRRSLEEKQKHCNYLIIDVADQESLRIIAAAVKDQPVVCGSSGIAEELALLEQPQQQGRGCTAAAAAGTGVLCAAGSLMPQTKAQVAAFRKEHPSFKLDTLKLFSDRKEELVSGLIKELTDTLSAGKHALLYASHLPEEVQATKELGYQQGYSNTEVSRCITRTIASMIEEVSRLSGVRRFLIAGGETSAAVCAQLGVNGLKVVQEIEPGLPSCISLNEPHRLFVLKSGSFGTPSFFDKAIEVLSES